MAGERHSGSYLAQVSLVIVGEGQVRPQEVPRETSGIRARTVCGVQPTEGSLDSWVLQELRGLEGGAFGELRPWVPSWGAAPGRGENVAEG